MIVYEMQNCNCFDGLLPAERLTREPGWGEVWCRHGPPRRLLILGGISDRSCVM